MSVRLKPGMALDMWVRRKYEEYVIPKPLPPVWEYTETPPQRKHRNAWEDEAHWGKPNNSKPKHKDHRLGLVRTKVRFT